MTKQKVDNIVELLPEGLTDETVETIAEIVDGVITEQVEERASLMEAKVNAYLRMKIDELKEQAVRELEQENDVFRNAQLFESMKAYMALELSSDDESNAISEVVEEQQKTKEELEVLVEELNGLVEENEKLTQLNSALFAKNDKLDEEISRLSDEVVSLEESIDKPFKSSEEAYVITETEDTITRKLENSNNEFLTEDIMRFMPTSHND